MALIVRTLACTYFDGYRIEPHAHPWGQLIYAGSGVMRVSAEGRLWLVPPARAVWAPAGVTHEITARGDFAMRSIYFAPELAPRLPADCRALETTPLLRELVLHAVGIGMLTAEDEAHRRLAEVMIDVIGQAAVLPLSLPLPRDRRAVAATERLHADPSDPADLAELAKGAGASPRTLQRLFRQETGLRLTEWRQRLRLLHAAGLLGAGATVTAAGLEAGYAGTSAFIAAFRRAFGCTPARMR